MIATPFLLHVFLALAMLSGTEGRKASKALKLLAAAAGSCPGVCNVWTPQWPFRCDNNYCESQCRSHGYNIGGCSDSFTCCCYPSTCDQVCYMSDPQTGLQLCVNAYCNSGCKSHGFKMGGCSDSLDCCCYGPTVANPCYMYDPKGLQSCVNAYCNFQCRGYGYNSGACSDSSTCCCS